MGMLQITVAGDESGPVVRLSGECDLSVTGQLSDALNAQIAGGQQHLTVDLSGLRFADSACIRVLVKAHRALTERGGTLELAFPQRSVARVLSLLGVDQRLPVRLRATPGDATDAPLWMSPETRGSRWDAGPADRHRRRSAARRTFSTQLGRIGEGAKNWAASLEWEGHDG